MEILWIITAALIIQRNIYRLILKFSLHVSFFRNIKLILLFLFIFFFKEEIQ